MRSDVYIKHNVSRYLYDAAVSAISKTGLKHPATVVLDLAQCVSDDASDVHDTPTLDRKFFFIIASIAPDDALFKRIYNLVRELHEVEAVETKDGSSERKEQSEKIYEICEEIRKISD